MIQRIAFCCVMWLTVTSLSADDALRADAAKAMRRAVGFYCESVSSHGGYLYRYSADLTKQEGEGRVGRETVWVQPPGTPSVGMAFLNAYSRTKDPYLLEAAKAAGECLIQGQLRSGGWTAHIEFDPKLRAKFAYRVDPPRAKAFNVSSFDDDKTQSALRMLITLDAALQFKDPRVHEAATFALDSVLAAQFPHGGWAQGFDEPIDPSQHPARRASYPAEWSRKYLGQKYWLLPTFNDNAISDTIHMLLMASRVYGEPRYRQAALKAGEFIILAQMPEPQPAWAQQYDFQLHPAWARRFEPPAISGGESQRLIDTLMLLHLESEDQKFLEPIPRAIAYLRRSEISPGRVARFYELQTNRPLYFTREYELTYDDSDLPTHYSFQMGSNVDNLEKQFDALQSASEKKRAEQLQARFRVSISVPKDTDVRGIIRSLDERGAWVEKAALRYHGKDDPTRDIIDSATFAKFLDTLSRYVATQQRNQ